jgi:hypothetical protein
LPLAVGWSDAKTAEHGLDGQDEVFQPLHRLLEPHRAGLGIDDPVDLGARRQVADALWINDIGRERATGPAVLANRGHAQNLDLQHVAGLGALDMDGPVHGIAALGAGTAVLVEPGRIERLGDDGIAIGHAEGCGEL